MTVRVVMRELPTPWLWLLGIGLFFQISGELFNNDGSRHATQMYMLLFLPALILLFYQRFALNLWRQPVGWIFLGVSAWVVLVGIFHPGSQSGAFYWLKIFLLLVLYVFAVASLSRYPHAFLWLVTAVVLVSSAFAWWTLINQFVVLEKAVTYSFLRNSGRLFEVGWSGFGDLKHPVLAGLYYGLFAVLIVAILVGQNVRLWLALALFIALSGLLIYVLLSFSRGAWFATCSGGLTFLLLCRNRKSLSLLVAGLLMLSAAIVIFWPELQNERIRGLSSREYIWLDWFERFQGFWLWGEGGAAEFVFRLPNRFSAFHAHSLYLQFWYEYGVIGFFLLASLIVAVLRKGWQCREQFLAKVALALMVFVLVGMVSDIDSLFKQPNIVWTMFWMPVGILLGISQSEKELAEK